MNGSAHDIRPCGPTAHGYVFERPGGELIALSHYQGKVVLVVNIASACAFTRQLDDLRTLKERYSGKPFEIVAVPSNDFHQEPLSNEAVAEFCDVNFRVNFPISSKVRVKGWAGHPFFQWARSQKGFFAAPRWNFYKYLITPAGELDGYFLPWRRPTSASITKRIDQLLPLTQGHAHASDHG